MKKVLIVGGGTAGAVISSRINAFCDLTIIESSNHHSLPVYYRVPLLIGLLFAKLNGFVKKKHVRMGATRFVPMYISNVLGGASVINGCVHTSGSRGIWKALLDRFEFTFDDLEKSWNSLFSYSSKKERILLRRYKPDLIDTVFLESLRFMGVPTGDTDWVDSPVSGPTVNNVGRFTRSSVLNLSPFSNSRLVTSKTVANLVVDENKCAIGVFDGVDFHRADMVILCAGVFGTNRLLRTSTKHLDGSFGEQVSLGCADKVKDHVNLRVNFDLRLKALSINDIRGNFFNSLTLAVKHSLGLSTIMQGTGATSTAYLDLNEDGVVDTKLNLLRFAEQGRSVGLQADDLSSRARFSISITPIQPESAGHFTADGEGYSFDPAYLESEADIELLRKALSYVLSVLRTSPFGDFIINIDKEEAIKSDPLTYIQDNVYSGFHPIGGCQGLVSNDFSVRGYKNVFICDSSILDNYVSSNIHSTVAILADLFSRRLIAKYLLP